LSLGLGLASQEVDVLANSTNEKGIKLYGYDKMTRPHLSIQAQVSKLGKMSSVLGLVQNR
jgi:hypothetical protein